MDYSSSRAGGQAAADRSDYPAKPEAHTEEERRFLEAVYAKAAILEKEQARRKAAKMRRRQGQWAFVSGMLGLLSLTAFIVYEYEFSIGAVFGLSILWMSAAAVQEQVKLRAGAVFGRGKADADPAAAADFRPAR